MSGRNGRSCALRKLTFDQKLDYLELLIKHLDNEIKEYKNRYFSEDEVAQQPESEEEMDVVSVKTSDEED